MQLTPYLLVIAVAATGCDNDFKDKPAAQSQAVAEAKEASKATAKKPAAKDEPAATTTTVALPIVAASSKIGWVGAKVTGKHEGDFKRFSGTAKVSGPQLTSLEFEVETASVQSDAEKLTGHLKSEDFFAVEKHPKATFKSTKVSSKASGEMSHEITGDLTLRGVTRSITFPAKVTIEGSSVKGSSEFTINRQDFGIAYAGMKDDLIKDEVLLKLEVLFEKS